MLPSVRTLDLFKQSKDKRKDETEDEQITFTSKRQRTFASVRNQFVVHVFVPLEEEDEQIQDIYDDLSDITEKVVFEKDPHISLLRGHYAVQYHQIDPLLNQLETAIKSFNQFVLCLSKVRLFNNDEKSRSFIAICEIQQNENTSIKRKESANQSDDLKVHQNSKVGAGYSSVNRQPRHELIKSIHSILKEYRSEIVPLEDKQIEHFIYHTSIAWFLPADEEIGQRMVDQVTEHFAEQVILKRVNKVHIVIGHRKKVVDLS